MYIGEAETQTASMNQVCEEIIQSMEQTQRSISSFLFAFGLKGNAYDSAKTFMAQTYFPLAQGFIYLCKELIDQHTKYPSDFRVEVASTDVVETEVIDQIAELNRIIDSLRETSETVPLLHVSVMLYEKMKQMLEVKLERLYTFHETSASNYETAIELANEITTGLQEIDNGKGFNSITGTFSTKGMNLDWATKLTDIHYGKRAEEEYAEYLAQFSNEKDRVDGKEKIMDILKYEDANPKYVDQTNEFLSPLGERDSIDIKHLMYTAEEPFRTLGMKYLDRFEIIILTPEIREEKEIASDGVFRYWEDTIYLEIENLRDDDRGSYYTYFHEVAHAFDYYYGQDNKDMLQEMIEDDDLEFDGSTFFTDVHKKDEHTLSDRMYEDASNNFQVELAKELESPKYEHLDVEEKQEMVDNVTENLMAQNNKFELLSEEEQELQKVIDRKYTNLLEGPDHNTASDVYGGVTNKTIEGNYNHESDYWFDEKGNRIKEPNREGFAEYYARIISPESDENRGTQSVEEYLFLSKEQMDEYFRQMGEGDLK